MPWRAHPRDAARASAPSLRLVPAGAALHGNEHDPRRASGAAGEPEFNPYGLMAWWPRA